MSEWVIKPLNQLANFQKGRKVATSEYDLPGYVPYLGAGSLSGKDDGYGLNFLGVNASINDVLMLWDGERSGLVGRNLYGVVSSTVAKLTPNDLLNSQLLFYLLQFNYEWIQNRRTGTGIPHVPKDLGRILKLKFPKDKSVQWKIANVLQTIDQAIEKTEALIEKYQQIKAGLMHDLFTRGIGADGKLRPPREQAPELYQETQIGWIPKEWKIDAFGNRVEVIDPNPSHRYPIEVDDGYPICSTENFDEDDSFDLSKSKKVSERTFLSQNNRCGFKLTDVIFARKGKIGLARRYGFEKKVFSHTVVIMKPTDHLVDAEWLLWISRANWFLGEIEAKMNTNSGVPTLGVEFIKSIIVPFPDESEQRKITAVLETVSKRIKVESETLKKMIELKSGLMHDLLTGKVQVHTNTAEEAHV